MMHSKIDLADQGKKLEQKGRHEQSLRVWPVLVLWVFVPLCWVPGWLNPNELFFLMIRFLGPGLLGILFLVWWLSFSRAGWKERIVVFLGTIVALVGVAIFCHSTVIGFPLFALTFPMGIALFTLLVILLRNSNSVLRSGMVLLGVLLGFGFSLTLRVEGLWGGDARTQYQWRWTKAVDESLKTTTSKEAVTSQYSSEQIQGWLSQPQWPGFRGPLRDGVVRGGEEIETDWESHPPKVLWKRDVGLGWSSFSVAGNLLFTMEQRGKEECVICYDSQTGEEVWIYGVTARFEDNLGGPGPRATPTIALEDVFSLGAYGHLVRLDGETGKEVWSVDLRKVALREPPVWGFSSSPLIVGNCVIVHAGGKSDLGVLAFDVETGEKVWGSHSGDHSYSSPQLIKLHGKDLLAMVSNSGVDLLDPANGKIVLNYQWKIDAYRCPQPALIDDRFIMFGGESGTHLVEVLQTEDGLKVGKKIEILRQRPDFNDLVVEGNLAFGFSGARFRVIDAFNGKTQDCGGRYGKGQVILLKQSGLLLVLSEEGELVLLEIDGKELEELGRFEALNDRTWNHPVLVGDRLYVRNSKQAMCIQLPTVNK